MFNILDYILFYEVKVMFILFFKIVIYLFWEICEIVGEKKNY